MHYCVISTTMKWRGKRTVLHMMSDNYFIASRFIIQDVVKLAIHKVILLYSYQTVNETAKTDNARTGVILKLYYQLLQNHLV